tara:strand:- start:1452 stop:1655 length:204 start_codon:yes stop_codon:yes gene_type:complete
MKPGDLIVFKPIHSHPDDWSNPVLILEKLGAHSDGEPLWIGWCDGMRVYVSEHEHDIAYIKKDEKSG